MSGGALAVRATDDQLAVVESIVSQVAAFNGQDQGGHFGKAFRMAAAIRALHQAITPEMLKDVMGLQGTGLGFLTDKDKNGGYDDKTVKLVAIEAALMGAYWVGNEFNIISERPYLTKNFFTRKLREFPGFTDLKMYPGVPVMACDKGALVPYVATWKLNGVADRIERTLNKLEGGKELDERICVKVNAGMGADAILGKAERKIKAAIYARLTGSEVHDGDVDDVLPPNGKRPAQTMDQLADRLSGHERPENSDDVDQNLIDGVNMDLPDAASIGDCEAINSKWAKHCKTEADRTAVIGLCDAKADSIRASRGENSNKK